MDKSYFIKEKVRKTINIKKKNRKTPIKFNIYDYTDISKNMVFQMYEKKTRFGLEDFSLDENELKMVFTLFTDATPTLDELADMIEAPNFYMEIIFNEIEMILGELAILYTQEQTKKLAQLKLESALEDYKEQVVEMMKDVDLKGVSDALNKIEG